MLVTIKETIETTRELGLPAFFKENTKLDPWYLAVLGEDQVIKLDGKSMSIYESPSVVNNEITKALTEYLPITEDQFLAQYNRCRLFIADQLFPIAK